MKLKICLLGLLCLFFRANAQIHSLKTGDKVPDIQINDIINYPGNSARISDFKGKLLILDFWATWCPSCISHFPDMYALQQANRDKITILLVNSKNTRDREPAISSFLNKRSRQYRFSNVVMDTALSLMFPHHSLPHYAVIRNNTVVAITDAENINQVNIDRLLIDSAYRLNVKNDTLFKRNRPLFVDGNGGKTPDNLYRSLLTAQVPWLNHYIGFQKDEQGLCTRIYAVNIPLSQLYLFAYPSYHFDYSRIIYRISNSDAARLQGITENAPGKRQFTYEGIFPVRPVNDALGLMRADLKRYFNLKVDSGCMDTLSYVLRLDKNRQVKRSADGTVSETNINETDNAPKYLKNMPSEDLRRELQELYKIPFIDETGLTSNIDLVLPADLKDETGLTKSLLRQGIRLTREKRKVWYMILTQQPVTDQVNLIN